MRNLKAFTLAEIMIAMIIIMIISAIGMNYFKPNNNKLRLFAYAMIMNLQKGNTAIMARYSSLVATSVNPSTCPASTFSVGCKTCTAGTQNCTACMDGFQLIDNAAGGTVKKACKNKDTEVVSYSAIPAGVDGYCLRLADSFTLKGTANCDVKAAGDSTVNMEFANGSTLQGLSTPWIEPYSGSKDKYKNIVYDIDGSKGANKVWVDRVPLRIFAEGFLNGMVLPVDCTTGGDNYFYNNNSVVTLADNKKNQYCKQKWDATGAWANKNFLLDANVVSYDIYRTESDDENAKTKVLVSGTSLIKANCAAYGDEGGYNIKVCSSLSTTDESASNKQGLRIHQQCVTKRMCKTCLTKSGENICPRDDNGKDVTSEAQCLAINEKYNPDDINCFILPHKPSAGAGFIFNGMLDNLDM